MNTWWRNLNFKYKLYWLFGSTVALLLALLISVILIFNVQRAIRTIIASKGVWANYQKTLQINLIDYMVTGSEDSYQRYTEAKEIMLHFRKARLLLKEKEFKYEEIKYHLVMAKSHPDDLRSAILLLRYGSSAPDVKRILNIWEEAELFLFSNLEIIDTPPSNYSDIGVIELKKRIADITHLENKLLAYQEDFADTLLDFVRIVETKLMYSLLIFVVVIFSLCYVILILVISSFRNAIDYIQDVVKDVSVGRFDRRVVFPDGDLMAEFASEINKMFKALKDQVIGRLAAEVGEARLSLMADAMPLIFIIKNENYDLEFLNQRGWDFLGLESKDPASLDLADYIHTDDRNRFIEANLESKFNLKTLNEEFRMKNSKGDYTWMLFRMVPLLDKENQIYKWYGSITDIDTVKKVSEDLKKAVQARDEFLSMASHELKTPLTSLKMQLQMRMRYIDRGDSLINRLEKMVKDDEKQVNRLIRLVDDMLDISRIQKERIDLVKTEFNLKDLIIEVVDRHSSVFHSVNSDIVLETLEPIKGYWDRFKIEQILINLITNALKYGNHKDIFIGCYQETNKACFYVKDQGIGIDKKDLERIFVLFERVQSNVNISGLGLGLYIVKKMVEAHGGEIIIDSEAMKGSTFTVKLPLE